MSEPTVYLNERISQKTVRKLRKYEKENKLKSSISATIEHLLETAWKYESLKK